MSDSVLLSLLKAADIVSSAKACKIVSVQISELATGFAAVSRVGLVIDDIPCILHVSIPTKLTFMSASRAVEREGQYLDIAFDMVDL